MPKQEIPINFVASFKVGDNLVYNASVLCKLVEMNQCGDFNKPIVLQIAAILEASLSEIISRAQRHNREGVPLISEEDRREIAGKKVDKFSKVIDVMRKYALLDDVNEQIYDDLHAIRRYRNKIHIQDDVAIVGLSRDEEEIFSTEIVEWAVALNSSVLLFLSDRLSRPNHIAGHVQPIEIPTIQT